MIGCANISDWIGGANSNPVNVSDVLLKGINPDVIGGIGAGTPIVRGFGQPPFIVIGVHDERQTQLMIVGSTLGAPCLGFGSAQRWQEQASEDCDDGDYHQ